MRQAVKVSRRTLLVSAAGVVAMGLAGRGLDRNAAAALPGRPGPGTIGTTGTIGITGTTGNDGRRLAAILERYGAELGPGG